MAFISGDRSQAVFMGYCIDDFVEKNSKARFIVSVVEKLDLKELYIRYSDKGAESYDPKIMLSIIFLAFSESVYTTRKIENFCKKHVDFIYASCNLRPDHSTISRFINRNMDLMRDFFIQIVRIAKEENYSDFKEIAIDGSKIKSSSSKKKSYREDKLKRYIKAMGIEIDEYLEKLTEEPEGEEKEEIVKKVEKLKVKKKTIESRKTHLGERKKEIKEEHRKNHQINIVEPEAYMMDMGYGKGYSPAYNAQLSVDIETHLIVAMDVITDRNDKRSFSKQHKNIESVIGKSGKRKYVADSGYESYDQLEYIEKAGIEAYIVTDEESENKLEEIKQSGRRLKKSDFAYIKDGDYYLCPAGRKLMFYKIEKSRDFEGRKYRSENCSGCEFMDQCLAKKNRSGLRTFSRNNKEVLREAMARRSKSEKAKELFEKRKISVEPVIGNIKENMKFNRFLRRGVKNVSGEFALVCTGHNINKLYKMIKDGVNNICSEILALTMEIRAYMAI